MRPFAGDLKRLGRTREDQAGVITWSWEHFYGRRVACRLRLDAYLATHDQYLNMLHAGAHSRVWRSLHAEMLTGSRRARASIRCRMLLFIGLDRAMPKKTQTKASGWRNVTLLCDVRSGTVVELLQLALFELLQRESTGRLGQMRVLLGVSSAVGDGWCAWDHRFGQYWP